MIMCSKNLWIFQWNRNLIFFESYLDFHINEFLVCSIFFVFKTIFLFANIPGTFLRKERILFSHEIWYKYSEFWRVF